MTECPHVWKRNAHGDQCLRCGEQRYYQEHDRDKPPETRCPASVLANPQEATDA